ncbi:MAG: hypothetical protein NT162_02025, partial [Candidatus Woesebacteria bacterium]|nr:hypothetical protein [Candidatus Woesebacteria bacterium]
YLGKRKTKWVHPQAVLNFFRKNSVSKPLSKNIKDDVKCVVKVANKYKLFVEGESQITSGILDELTFE